MWSCLDRSSLHCTDDTSNLRLVPPPQTPSLESSRVAAGRQARVNVFFGRAPFVRLGLDPFNRYPKQLLRQCEHVHGVAAAGGVRFGSQTYSEGSDRPAAGRDSDVLAAVDRISDRGADDL